MQRRVTKQPRKKGVRQRGGRARVESIRDFGANPIDRLRDLSVWLLCAFLDTLFLALWAVAPWALSIILSDQLALRGFDSIVLMVLRVLFAAATLTPIGIYIYRDTRLMIIRANARIRDERERSIGDT